MIAEHAAVVDAILTGDPDRAEAVMREHMEQLAAGFARQYANLRDEIVGW